MDMKNVSFERNLTCGRQVEEAVRKWLTELLPDYDVFISDQEDPIERIEWSCIDVIVAVGHRPVLGIECKLGQEKYQACKNRCGWDGDYNTPLNRSSLHRYKEARFPVWVININKWCHKGFTAPLPVILASPNDAGQNTKRSGEVIYNVDSSNWNTYEGDFTLKDILKDIIKKEQL